MNWTATASILLALAVALGAFGAHGLRSRLDAYSMGVWEKAVFYHFVHALGMLMVSILPRTGTFPPEGADLVCWFLLAGIAFIAAWLLLAWRLRRP
jgi:uncharacterized membrane protein YgdD (TMEM256/DUF423 family)